MALRKYKFVEWQADEIERPKLSPVSDANQFAPTRSPALELQSRLEILVDSAPKTEAKYPLPVRVVLPLVLSGTLWAAILFLV
jgi:hypothetical protein